MTYKLVALDLDGTLLTKEGQVLPRTKEVIGRIREQGTEVTLCTGRMFRSAFSIAEELKLTLPLITYNGGLVMSLDGREILYQRSLSVRHARRIIEEARKHSFAINYYYEDRLLVEEIKEQNRLYAQWTGVPLETVADLTALPFEPIKVLLMGEPEQLNAFGEECRQFLGDEVYITKSWSTYLEFMHPEATKGRGLAALARYLGIETNSIVGMGDSYNDLEMFSHVGLAVAMGNAHQAVKEAADYVTGTNEENGVAQALEKFILGKN
ncbi:MAG: HAD family phosphatase [Clostridia bacterium]|nr:HAD family phosphatase [Clostridia bacterium]